MNIIGSNEKNHDTRITTRMMKRNYFISEQESIGQWLVNIEDYRRCIDQWRDQDLLNVCDSQRANNFLRCAAQLQALSTEDYSDEALSAKVEQCYSLKIEYSALKSEFMQMVMRQQTSAHLQALCLTSLYDTVIKTMDLPAFNQLCTLVQSSKKLSHLWTSHDFWRRLILPQESHRWYWAKDTKNLGDLVILLTHPQMGQFFQKNISQLTKKRREPLRSILNFLTLPYTHALFTGEDGEYFCGELLKLFNGGLKTKLEILNRCSDVSFFVGEAKKTLVIKVLKKKGVLHQFKEAMTSFSDVLKQSNCEPMDLLNVLLIMSQPGRMIRLLSCMPFRFADLFPTANPEELSLTHILNTGSMFSKLCHTVITCCHLLFQSNKKLLLSQVPMDIEFKLELVWMHDRCPAHVQSALRKLCEFNLLTPAQRKNLTKFLDSPHRDVMGYVFLSCDSIDQAVFHLLFLHAERLCTNESLNTWRQIPVGALTIEHIRHLVTLDDPTLLIAYLNDQFNLRDVFVEAPAVEINYNQSIHNAMVEQSIIESSKKLLARYLPVLALTALSTPSTSDSVRADSTARALTLFYEHVESSSLAKVRGKDHWNETSSVCYQEMRQWLEALPDETFKPNYINCFERIQQLQYIRKESKLSMTTLFALLWILIHDETLRIGSLDDALGTFKEMFYEIQRGYNIVPQEEMTRRFNLIRINGMIYRDDGCRDDPICTGGTFNKGIEKFTTVHPDLYVHYKTLTTASMKFQKLVKEIAVEYALKSGQVALVQSILNDGVGRIWDEISPSISARMLDEFGDLYQPEGEYHAQFVGMMSAGPDVDVSDVEALHTFVAQELVCGAKRSFGLFACASNDNPQDEHPNQWRRVDDADTEDPVEVKLSH